MTERAGRGDVMVAVEDPDQVQQLVRTAGDLARQRAGTVRLVTVVVKPYDSPFGIFTDETIVREFAADSHELLDQATAPEGVDVVRDLVVARSVDAGIVRAVTQDQPDALVIGWDSDPRRSDVVLGSTVDTVLERAPTDVVVERIGREANGVESVLLPVAGGPHVGVAASIATAIAAANDASVTVLSVATDGTSEPEAKGYAADGARAVADQDMGIEAVETVVRRGETPTDVIVEAAADHDVVVLGATRKGALRGRLVGSVPRRVVRDTDTTVILGRDAAEAAGLWERLVSLVRK
jgi:nucleotide-binding universal stress UspA family protein